MSNIEILNNFKSQISNVQNVSNFGNLSIRYCLDTRNSKLGFSPERSY